MQEARVVLGQDLFGDEQLSLSKLRLSRGLSQTQLAKAIGTSQPHVARIEASKGELLFDTASRIADALGVKLDDLRPLIESGRARHRAGTK